MTKFLVVASFTILFVVSCTTPVDARRYCGKKGKLCNNSVSFFKRLLEELRNTGEAPDEANTFETRDNLEDLEEKTRLLLELLRELDVDENEGATEEGKRVWGL